MVSGVWRNEVGSFLLFYIDQSSAAHCEEGSKLEANKFLEGSSAGVIDVHPLG